MVGGPSIHRLCENPFLAPAFRPGISKIKRNKYLRVALATYIRVFTQALHAGDNTTKKKISLGVLTHNHRGTRVIEGLKPREFFL